ncbi:alpha/beta fold hydrolase [Bordetella avium]|uniref:alpha/beta fold hydrolase n=1 Tax=Bordetella avium TaxID=521 RepID=UPI000E0B55EE|nr:alpha/beta hydrolase [Bordetella avium]AZY49826.1 alpha/beta hydrolase [Bordetella avium]AZY53164.1 alpha/beta hydrolase [Bordetella avium]RIQ12491.1 alpha/beta fold hydrolase [Bordetella avium]RIQ17582.1 alpha/beta fold hydrolase [Bordetella avium]RIQ32239.1 alpha/beta fold hydrolase [Bordetella avium]
MTRPTLYFVHGWACDAHFWDSLRARLHDWPQTVADAGYFGAPAETPPPGPVVAIGHSLGGMKLLADPPAHCQALILINSFGRFGAGQGFTQGVAPRLLDRMRTQLRARPQAVLKDFRLRAANGRTLPAAQGVPDIQRLDTDLLRLRDENRLTELHHWARPLLSLGAGADAILPLDAQAPATHFFPDGDHMLPLSDPDGCAQAILTFLKALPA